MIRLALLVGVVFACFVPAQQDVPAAGQSPRPKALVYEHVDQWTHSAALAGRLRAAGFDVAPLPLDRSPAEFDVDLIALGSFVSEEPHYDDYMRQHGKAFADYVAQGHVLVQFTQADQLEAVPPFLPAGLAARRADPDFGAVRPLATKHPLLRRVALDDGVLQLSKTRTGWEAFAQQAGFEVILGGGSARRPVLMEAAIGKGRLLLLAMAIDKQNDGEKEVDVDLQPRREAFVQRFFANLAAYAVAVREQQAPAVQPTPSSLPAAPFVPGSWTLAVLPDTQNYSLRYPGLWLMQTAWLVQHRDERDLRLVLQLGDIVNNNSDVEWRRAAAALRLLQGQVPFALVPGNHDYGPNGDSSTRDTGMNKWLSFAITSPTFGGAMTKGRLDNTFHRFDAWGRKWIVICLEWAPGDATVQWANEVMEQNPGRLGILVTHAYLDHDDRRFDHNDVTQLYSPHDYKTPGEKNDGEELWQKLVRKHDFVLTLNGHVLDDGTGYLASVNDQGRTVHQLMSNFQFRELGGEGYMRLLEFRPDGRTVQVKTYSPLYDRYLTEPDQQFTFAIE